MPASLSGVFNLQVLTATGVPAVGFRIYSYVNGTTTHKSAFTDAAGSIAHAYTSDGIGGLYIALNSRGELPAPLFLTTGPYDIALKTPAGATEWTRYARGQDDATANADASQALLVADLANNTDAAKGAAKIGYSGRTVAARLNDFKSVSDFGIIPDGVTNWEGVAGANWTNMLAASLATGVFWPKGYYATGINLGSDMSGARFHFEDGAVIGGVFHMISDAVPAQWLVSAISRAANVVTVVTTAAHGWATGRRIRVENVHNTGIGSVGFNGDDFTVTVLTGVSFTYAQTGINESGSVASGAYVATRPIKDVVITGRLTTTDRFGTINAKNCYAERIWIKSSPSQHSAYPGTTCRGAHIYAGTDNLHIEELIIDDAGGANTDAALAVDGNAWNPSNLTIDYCWIKDSDCHGVYLTGGGHRFGTLRVDGFARGVYTGTLQDSDGAVQSGHVKGLWVNRCWDTEISVLRTSQILTGSRAFERNQVVIDETGSTFFGKDNHGIKIGSWFANNVRRFGLGFADLDNDSFRCNVAVGLMEVRIDPAGLNAGEFAVKAVGGSVGSRVSIGTLRFIDLGASQGMYIETTAIVSIKKLECVNHSARALQARGRVTIDDVDIKNNAGSAANPLIHFSHTAAQGSSINNIYADSVTKVTSRVLSIDNGTINVKIGQITTVNHANATGTVWLDAVSGASIAALHMIGPDSTGIGVGYNGAVTDHYLGPGRVEGFSKGFAKGTASFARCTAVGLNGNGNTTSTDLTAGSFAMLGCNGVTL